MAIIDIEGLRIVEVPVEDEWYSRIEFYYENPPVVCACYAIFDRKKCLYVGATNNLFKRIIHDHQILYGRLADTDIGKEILPFLRCFYVECDRGYLRHLESMLISHLNPTMNKRRAFRRSIHGKS